MNFKNIKLDKSMYQSPGGMGALLEKMDPSSQYIGTSYERLDAFERQLKRFGIKVSGADSSPISKFFATSDCASLFPEYVARAVAKGADQNRVLTEIIASKTEIDSMDYRSVTIDLGNKDLSESIDEGQEIPETSILPNENLVRLKKRGRLLHASYEAIRFQRSDIFTVAVSQIGAYIAKAQLKDAIQVLLGEGDNEAEKKTIQGELTYKDLLELWGKFEDFEMNVLLASPDMTLELLALDELQDPNNGLRFLSTGSLSTPLGATLLKSSAVPEGTIIALDRRFALEMVSAGGVQVEYDKLINTQLERAAVTEISGFSKIFPDAVKVLVRA